MWFFVPDWDDRVDPGYDFITDRFALKRDPWADDRYAHEIMPESVYDGLLVSRMALGESGPKRRAVERIGMRSYLRLPSGLRLLGDCGAFGYLRDREPRFAIEDLVDYYERLGFDYGVSVDHAIVPAVNEQRAYRYNLTLRNAEVFLREHRRRTCAFVPIGAVQGWDLPSYVEAAETIVAMGYDYIAIGGLARSRTNTVLQTVASIRATVPEKTRIHVFGISRASLLTQFVAWGISSVDSASPIRQAWLSAEDNYYDPRGDATYAALRIPIAEQERVVSDSLVARSETSLGAMREAERAALAAVRAYDTGNEPLSNTLSALMDYDSLLAGRRDGQRADTRRALYERTLRVRPWRRCPCPICTDLGVEVMIFRGNNRNRRRGFHNLWVVHRRLKHPSQGREKIAN